MKTQSHLWLWLFGSYLKYGILSSCICSSLVSVCAMKGIPVGPLAQWGKNLTYYLTPFFCLVNRDMHYTGSACRGTDLPSGRLLYIHTYIHTYYSFKYEKGRFWYCSSVCISISPRSFYLCTWSPLWSRGNIFASHIAGQGSIPGRVSFPGWSFFRANVSKI